MKGDVELKLGGKTVTLKPTLEAAMRVDEAFGGFLEATRQVSAIRLSAFCTIIAAGLGRHVDEVRDEVFRTGLSSLVDGVMIFTVSLANGGQPPRADGEEADGAGE